MRATVEPAVHVIRTALLTLLALVGFAANSILNRWALAGGAIDPTSFATLRLASGAAALWLLVVVLRLRRRAPGLTVAPPGRAAGSWRAATALFLYAVPFSLAYVTLSAGTGALVLFGAVQVTMIGVGLHQGERPKPIEWAGLAVALGGLAYLVAPGLAAPSPVGAALMATAGVAWGVYSLLGRGGGDPLATTAGNFLRAAPLALLVTLVVGLLAAPRLSATGTGVTLAMVSGALTSGVAYALWYAALPRLSATAAATVQLSVPVLAALGGVGFLGEAVTLRLTVASVLVLGGVGWALAGRRRA